MINTTNQIGLDTMNSKIIAEHLNTLLANYQVFYLNTRGFHWNIRGKNFFELHEKFEELYNDSKAKIDELAERIVTLGFIPLHTLEDYLKHSNVKSVKNVSKGNEAMKSILNTYQILLPLEREILKVTEQFNDEGTNAMISDYIREQEKLVWMFSAFVNEN